MKALAILASVVTGLLALAVFVAFGLAIWHPWGHADEWASTGTLIFLAAVVTGGASAFCWIEVKS